ncbi:MAG: EAL domain-containing protein [Gallionella sp.]|nr:EAL domain-containing protein [Gallionella sp.]
MSKPALDLLTFNQSFTEQEQHLKYKIAFLNSVFSLAVLVAFVMGFYRWQHSQLMGAIDFAFSAVGLLVLYYLRRHKEHLEGISTLAIVLAYLLFLAVYLLASENLMRLSLFFLLSAAVFFLKGNKVGLGWLVFIQLTIILPHLMPSFSADYSHIDIVTTCLYLSALYLIFWNYERQKEQFHQREQLLTMQRGIDQRLHLALESARMGVWEFDLRTRKLFWSPEVYRLFDIEEEPASMELLKRVVHPDDLEAMQAAMDRTATTREPYFVEFRIVASGKLRWAEDRGEVQYDPEGRPLRVIGTVQDITMRKDTEAALRENQKRLHLALGAAKMGVWELDVVTHRLYWSPEIYLALGIESSDPTEDDIRKMMHPEDAPRVFREVETALAERTTGVRSQYRIITPDDRLIWVDAEGELQFDAQGVPYSIIGIARDITEYKVTEEAMEHSRRQLEEQRHLFETILDNAPLGIWMTDTKGKIQFINNGFCYATGVSEEAFLAAPHYADVLPKSVTESCMKSDRECLEQDAPHLSLEWLPFVDGREHLLEITKVRVKSRDGTVLGLIGLSVDVTERKEHEKQLEQIAHYDALTGVPNRVLLANRLAQALAYTKRDKTLMAVCYLDLDGFKPINDSFGHEIGDQALVEIARRIKHTIRAEDTVARLGGDEFVVLLVGMQVSDEYENSLNRLLRSIEQPIEIKGQSIRLSASIGVALCPGDDLDVDTLLRQADQAMYVAKQSGKNRYHLFDSAQDMRVRSHHELVEQIRNGLAQGEFELYYQPKVEMQTRRLMGAEALIRWHHPQRGLLLPAEFLRAIENTEVEIEVGEWVIASALEQMRSWREAGSDIDVSVNISAYHLQSLGFVERLHAQMQHFSMEQSKNTLQIEVLETAALEDVEKVGNIIHSCREFGVSFALDDFGIGYSSLKYLSFFDLDALKIDQSFVHDMMVEKGDHAIVQGIIALAKAFGREVVAEGVENDAQYQTLLLMGCQVGQGNGIGLPMPAAALIEWAKAVKPVSP